MKKKIYLLLATPIFLYSCSGQKIGSRGFYDFNKKSLSSGDHIDSPKLERPVAVKAGSDVQLEIYNYNPLKYEIIVEDTSVAYFQNNADKIAGMIITPAIPAGMDIEKTGTSNFQKHGDASPLKRETMITCNILIDLHNSLRETALELAKATRDYKQFMLKMETLDGQITTLKQMDVPDSTAVHAQLTIFLTELDSVIAKTSKAPLSVDPHAINSINLSQLELSYYNDIQKAREEAADIKKEIMKLKDDHCRNFHDLYVKSVADADKVEEDWKTFDNNRTNKVLPAFNIRISQYDQLKFFLYNKPRFITPAITIDKDQHTINIYRKEIGKDQKSYVDKITIEPIRGFKIDIATGLFVSGLTDKQYSLNTKDSIFVKQHISDGGLRDTLVSGQFTRIYEKDQAPVSIGGMIYLHAHSQTATLFNYGFSLGFGALFNDQARLCFSAGPSLLIGKKQRLVLNAGVILGQVERLRAPYETGQWYNEKIDNVPTDKAWKTSYMFGVSWNL